MKLKLVITFCVSILSLSTFAAESKIQTSNELGELWQREEIYFVPKDKDAVLNWTGTLYRNDSGKCYELNQKEITDKVTSKEIKCEAEFLKKAREPYTKISDFKDYQAKFLSCLKSSDQKCLRGLISKNLQVSFGVDGMQDRRDYIFATWKKENFNRLHDLVQKGAVGNDDSKTFPPEVSDGGVGYRGEFKKENGGWLLKSFLAGD